MPSSRPSISRPRRVLLAIAACGLTASLAACGGTVEGEQPTVGPAATIAMMPSNNPFMSALAFTDGLGTARLEITSSTQVGRTHRSVSGEATAAFDPRGVGVATWSADGAVTDELANDKAVFVRPANEYGLWTQRPDGERSETSRLLTPLLGLGEVTGLRDEGPDTVAGEPATRYAGQLAADPRRLRAMGLSDDDLALLGDAWEGASLAVAVWVDDRNRVVRVDRTFDGFGETGAPVRAETSTVLSDFTAPLDLTAPPTRSIAAPA